MALRKLLGARLVNKAGTAVPVESLEEKTAVGLCALPASPRSAPRRGA
jgi:hypothetical protein